MALRRLAGRIVLDVVSLLVVASPFVGLETFARPYRRGFFCNDESISYPYLGDSVSSPVLFAVVLLVPLVVIVAVELTHLIAGKVRDSLSDQWTVRNYFVLLYKIYGIYLFGQAVTMSMTELGKFTVGRLRPHFLAVCQPNRTALDCSGEIYYRYITEDVCTSGDTAKLIEARKSFPSGHSSLSFCYAVFLVIYLHARITWDFSRLLKPCLQTLVMLSATYISLSRISDYRHHWSDVLVGATVGTIVAVLVGLYVSSAISGWKLEHRRQSSYQNLDGEPAMSLD